MNVDTKLHLLTVRPEELGQAAALVARGMRDNPIHVAAFGEDADTRERRLAALFGTALPLVSAKGALLGAYTGGALVGVAGVAEPGRCQPSGGEALRLLARVLPSVGPAALMRMGAWVRGWARRDPAAGHWHLGPVAVDRSLQGHGIGSALVQEVCARVDRTGGLLYLETDKPENVRFYRKYGFETIVEAPVLGVKNWFMQRPARP